MIWCFALSNHHKLPAFTLSIPPQRSWRYMFSWEHRIVELVQSWVSQTVCNHRLTEDHFGRSSPPPPPSTSTDCCKSYHAFPLSEASPWLQTCYVVSCDYRLHPDRYKPNSWDLDKVDLNNRLSIKILCRKLDPVGSTVRYEMMKLCTGSV